MKYYLISYDLRSQGQNYSALYDEIKAYGDFKHPMESTWIIRVPDSISHVSVRDKLQSKMDSNDSVLVVDISSSTYAGYLPTTFWDWFKQENK